MTRLGGSSRGKSFRLGRLLETSRVGTGWNVSDLEVIKYHGSDRVLTWPDPSPGRSDPIPENICIFFLLVSG